MASSYNHQFFAFPSRVSQSLRNDRCQNILYKAAFEHFDEFPNVAALLLTSKSFQNSSFGANFLVNFVVDENTIILLESVLSPSSCFSLQFVPSLRIKQSSNLFEETSDHSETMNSHISNFVGELVETKYLQVSLQSLSLYSAKEEVFSFLFANRINAWPQLHDLILEKCRLTRTVLEMISESALQLRTISFSRSFGLNDAVLELFSKLSRVTSIDVEHCRMITDAGLEHIFKHSGIISLNLSGCDKITDSGFEHLSNLSCITSLDLHNCFNITNAGLKLISKVSRITSLNLFGCYNVADAGLEHISNFANITSLNFGHCYLIADAGLEHISKLSNLTTLDLSYCRLITDDGLEFIAKLSSIMSLDLACCDEISDVGLDHLSQLSRITWLSLSWCDRITDEAKTKFCTALPKCEIDD